MREHKYRAWDLINKKWLDASDIDYGVSKEGICGILIIGSFGRHCYELNEYTGLKDKNGKEIYEGDIICIPDTETESVDTGVGVGYAIAQSKISMLEEVIFKDGSFGIELTSNESYGFAGFYTFNCLLVDYIESKDIEVVGNIYENPELRKRR